MYYGYIRKLDSESQYIGFCVLLNGVMFSEIGGLFSVFENAISNLVENGSIICFNEKAEIISNTTSLAETSNEVAKIASFISNSIEGFQNLTKLPPPSYNVSIDEVKEFSIYDDISKIIDASSKYGYTYIYKNQQFNTPSLTSSNKIITRLYEEKQLLIKNYDTLQTKYDKLNNQKKQISKVITLVLIVIGCGIGIFLLSSNLDDTKSKLNSAKSEIEMKTNEISQLNNNISTLEGENSNLRQEVISLNSLKHKVSNAYPLIINNIEIANVDYNGNVKTDYGYTIYSSKTMYLQPRIKYDGLSSGDKTLKVKWYNPDGTLRRGSSSPSGFSQSESCYIYSGNGNTCTLNSWGNRTKGHWKAGTYRIEIWYDNVCLKSKTFTIYR